jgi:hypothetical protein
MKSNGEEQVDVSDVVDEGCGGDDYVRGNMA